MPIRQGRRHRTSEMTRFCETPRTSYCHCSQYISYMFYFCSSHGASTVPADRGERSARRPVSRVLYPPRRAGDGHSSGTPVTGRLARPTRTAARKPARRPPSRRMPACRPYLVLLPVGFTVPSPSPATRCALTAPFHPCRRAAAPAGGLLSVALSLGSPPPGVTRHRVSVEPGLSSPAALKAAKAAIRPSGAN